MKKEERINIEIKSCPSLDDSSVDTIKTICKHNISVIAKVNFETDSKS